MAFWKIITLAFATSILVDAKWLKHQKRDIPSSICDPIHNNTNLVQCYCSKDRGTQMIKNAECYLTVTSVSLEHNAWKSFRILKNAHKITFSNTKGIPLTYVPTNSIIEANGVSKFEIKYGIIERIEPFAFGNVSSVEEITLRDNGITSLSPHAFAHHKILKVISLDSNRLSEINRNVFLDLPELEKLYFTNNEISTIHDRAFIHLWHLKKLEIDRNKVFSLNFATFEGLKNLEKLDLSSNALEVIGDNTFEALENLKSLNIQENKIQMLDDKAFNGLNKLVSLSLANNKLTNIESDKIFEGLDALISLSLKANQITELKPAILAPILSNFYGSNSNFDIEDNNFPCNCSLDWFISLKNKTQNKLLKNNIENLKCIPDATLKEMWTKTTEATEKTSQALEEEAPPGQDYEYYDDTQLNGKLFYLDVRDLINCDNNTKNITEMNTTPLLKTKETSLATPITPRTTNKVTNQDLLDLPLVDSSTTISLEMTANEMKAATNKREKMDEKEYTTTRLATVSAKPVESKIYEDMASDEGRPDKIKAHRSIQENDNHTSSANKSFGCATLLVVIILLKSLAVNY